MVTLGHTMYELVWYDLKEGLAQLKMYTDPEKSPQNNASKQTFPKTVLQIYSKTSLQLQVVSQQPPGSIVPESHI